ncbi:MAG: trypsin-like peptidase domain-containing protein [Acidobacteriia bacterium]|nr:trypsin-like peptidase domain-containing protein [Terriglobia bacterium]
MFASVMEDFNATADRLRRSTVQVEGSRGGGGSGVIWREDGLVITNAHVARRATGRIQLADGRVARATVAARDAQLDLALLQADVRGLPAAEAGNSDALRVGEIVLAAGSPYGYAGTVTVGVIHANSARRWIEADLRLAPGNSGGPMADARGRIIGINTMVANGLAMAIPSNIVERFVARRGRRARRLGVTVEPVNMPQFGLLIVELEAEGPAQTAGLKVGDILTGAAGRPFQAPFDLALALEAGEGAVPLDVLRGGRAVTCEVYFEHPAVGAAVG